MSETLKAYCGMPEDNSTYLANTKLMPATQPIGEGTVGLLMLMSTLQYQAPYMNPIYSNAASQAGKAAFVQSGGQGTQDKVMQKAEAQAKDAAHSVGVTDTEIGIVLGSAKIVRDKQVDLNGPKIFFIKTHLTVGQDRGSVGLKMDF
jgi:hypothetical protein